MEINVERLPLGSVTLPAAHPRSDDGPCTIDGFVVHHPDGPIVVDTGVADDHDLLNDLYRPSCVDIVDALNDAGVDERDVVAIVNTHLHFDHCGQNRFLPGVPVIAQAAEVQMVEQPRFTIPEWARIDGDRARLIDGDEEIAPGVRILATPGHTPGHQSVVVDRGDDGPCVIVGQCTYTCAEFDAARPFPGDMHDESWLSAGRASVERLRALRPTVAFFSHDREVFWAC